MQCPSTGRLAAPPASTSSSCQVPAVLRCRSDRTHRPQSGARAEVLCRPAHGGAASPNASTGALVGLGHSQLAARRGESRQLTSQNAAVAGSLSGSVPDDDSTPSSSNDASSSPSHGPGQQSPYTLENTRTLVETAMLAAVSGLAYLLSTILKLDTSLGYFLPLPVVLATLRSGVGAGWRTMGATCFLLVVLLGPLRALTYLLMHGLLAATLGTLWKLQAGFWVGVLVGALVRMFGQLAYLVLSSVTMNENMFALLLSNVYSMLDRITATLGMTGAPSPMAVSCMMFSLLLVNGLSYNFLLNVIYRFILGAMGYKLGPLPKAIESYVYAGVPKP